MNEGHEHSLPGRFAVFSAKNGKPDVVARFENDDVWLTQDHLARLYNTSKQNVSQHLKSIFESGELDAETKVRNSLLWAKRKDKWLKDQYITIVLMSLSPLDTALTVLWRFGFANGRRNVCMS